MNKEQQETWKEIKKRRLELDNNRCFICKSKDNLICHHLTYKNKHKEKIEELIILCKSCHTKIHRIQAGKIPKWIKKEIKIELSSKFIKITSFIYKRLNKPQRVDLSFDEKFTELLIQKNDEGNFRVFPNHNDRFYFIKCSKLIFFENRDYGYGNIKFLKEGIILPIKRGKEEKVNI